MSDHSRPNFLFIMTDQHRWDWLGCAGHPVVKTPNIDALAAAGTRFGNFHVTSPVCMPNRASFMTGRYPSTHGLRYNGCVLPANTNCFTDVLAAAGYRTASIGKSHLQPFTSHPPLRKDDGKSRLIEEARMATNVTAITGNGSGRIVRTGKPSTILPRNCRTITAAPRPTAHRYPRNSIPRAMSPTGQSTGLASVREIRTRSLRMCHSRTRITPSIRPENTGTCTIRTSLRYRFPSRRTRTRPRPCNGWTNNGGPVPKR